MIRLKDFIESLDIHVGQTHRGDCPVCNGRNTFTATNDMGSVLYNCYKNSCRLSGSYQVNVDSQIIRSLLADRNSPESYSEQDLCTFDLPPYIVPYKEVTSPIDPMFLRKYDINPEDVMYDIRQDRLVFPVYTEQSRLVDAVGRSLTKRQPKWLRYASSPVPYVRGRCNDVAVVVEDAISAYVVGEHFGDHCCGVALLGTQLTAFHKKYIKTWFDNVIVALDPDARDKTVRMARELKGMALNLKDDLKYGRLEDFDNLEELIDA